MTTLERAREISILHRSDPDAWRKLSALCGDPDASPEELLILVDGWVDREGRAALASNPAVPIEGLLKLARGFPKKVMDNPVFALHLSVTPGFLESTSLYVQRSMVACPEVDERIFRRLAMRRSQRVMVRAAAAQNPRCPPDMMRGYLRHAWRVRRALARNVNLLKDLQPTLASDAKAEVRSAIAERRDADVDLLRCLGRPDEADLVTREVVLNSRTPEDVIDNLAEHGTRETRRLIEGRRKRFLAESAPAVRGSFGVGKSLSFSTSMSNYMRLRSGLKGGRR